MATSVKSRTDQAVQRLLPLAAWRELMNRIRAFRPDVVILVARKMPRLAECFGFAAGSGTVAVSDLAIPFIHPHIRGARVAIVDDIVNVGSTLEQTLNSVRSCEAAATKLFALGAKAGGPKVAEAVDCVWESPLDPRRYGELTQSVPAALHALAKPYDLEFPILPCRLAPPFRTAHQVYQWLTRRFGSEAVVSLPQPENDGSLCRYTLDFSGQAPGVHKLRLYLDVSTGRCNVVPFAIPPCLGGNLSGVPENALSKALLATVLRPLKSAPSAATLWPEEPYIRALLFAQALDYGLRKLDVLSGLLAVDAIFPVSLPDATWLFGPLTPGELTEGSEGFEPQVPFGFATYGSETSPFLDFVNTTLAGKGFLDRARGRIGGATDGFLIFSAIFEELANSVGSSDPDEFSFDWPYSREQIRESPYLRLRIGPTFEDLLSIYRTLSPDLKGSEEHFRRQISALLDYAIDDGAVVPTLAKYKSAFFRIYRKGESDAHDRAVERSLFAWRMYNKPLSLTRFAKINAILSLSAELPQVLTPSALMRGNVGSLQATVLDWEDVEIGKFLRNTGLVKVTQGDGDQRS